MKSWTSVSASERCVSASNTSRSPARACFRACAVASSGHEKVSIDLPHALFEGRGPNQFRHIKGLAATFIARQLGHQQLIRFDAAGRHDQICNVLVQAVSGLADQQYNPFRLDLPDGIGQRLHAMLVVGKINQYPDQTALHGVFKPIAAPRVVVFITAK